MSCCETVFLLVQHSWAWDPQAACLKIAGSVFSAVLSFPFGEDRERWLRSEKVEEIDSTVLASVFRQSKTVCLPNTETQIINPLFNFVYCFSENDLTTIVWLLRLKTFKSEINIEMFWVLAFVLCITHSVVYYVFFFSQFLKQDHLQTRKKVSHF